MLARISQPGIARYKDQCTDRTDLRQAKAAAMAMAEGADGAYRIRRALSATSTVSPHACSMRKPPRLSGGLSTALHSPCMEVTFNLNTIQMASPCTPQHLCGGSLMKGGPMSPGEP